jgi:hypothetical protein
VGSVSLSAVPDEDSPAAGGLQNTTSNLGAALGAALAGSILLAALRAAFLHGVQGNPAIPQELQTEATAPGRTASCRVLHGEGMTGSRTRPRHADLRQS